MLTNSLLPRRTLAEAMAAPANDFDAVRLLAALCVMISHAFSIATHNGTPEPLMVSSGMPLGHHAVHVFFGISGFLVLASLERRREAMPFLVARALRIIPGLFVVTLFCLALGAVLTTLPLADYLPHGDTWRYGFRAFFMFDGSIGLPEVFDSLAPGDITVNTPIWTLKYEWIAYIAMLSLWLVGLLSRRWFFPLVLCLALAGDMVISAYPGLMAMSVLDHSSRMGSCFLLGMAFWHYRAYVRLDWRIVLGLLAATILLSTTLLYRPLLYVTVVYLALFLALGLRARQKRGHGPDLSYGIYLYGWPLEQTVKLLFPALTPWGVIGSAVPLALVAAYLSWTLVEKPALHLRRKKKEPQQVPGSSTVF